MKFFLYVRKSTDDEGRQMLSIEAQLAELHEYAERESLSVVREFVESKTAKAPGRPVFNEMLDRIEKGEASALLSWHPDRLARNTVDGGRIVYLLDCGKLQSLSFPTFWFDNTPQGKFMLNIAFGQSKYYVDNLSENVCRGMRQKVRRGEFPGKPPIGYLNEPRFRTIIVNEPKAKLVRRMFEAYSTGRYSLEKLHALVKSWGLTSHRKKPLARSMLPLLLSNPFYVGLFRFSGEMHEGSHQPIISQDLFDKVQNVMARRGRPHKSRMKPLPFLGFIRCGECGAAITGEQQKGHHYYRCTKKMGACSQKRYIREETLADELRVSIERVSIPEDVGARMLAQIEKWNQDQTKSRSSGLARERSSLAKIETRLSRLLDVYIDGLIAADDYALKKEQFLREKAGITERISRIEQTGNAWLEPLKNFVKEAIEASITASSENPENLRDFHRRIGSNLKLIEPIRPKSSGKARSRDSEKSNGKSPSCSGRFAVTPEKGGVLRKSRHSAGAKPKSSSRRSSSRWAERGIPNLHVEYPNPWRVIADRRPCLTWSGRLDLNQRPQRPERCALSKLSYAPNRPGHSMRNGRAGQGSCSASAGPGLDIRGRPAYSEGVCPAAGTPKQPTGILYPGPIAATGRRWKPSTSVTANTCTRWP